MIESASTTETIAMNRAESLMPSSWSRTNLRNAPRACWTGGSPQNLAASVCPGVRVVLPLEPISLTSLYSRAHLSLSSAGGPSGR